jgi:hypothetical protein
MGDRITEHRTTQPTQPISHRALTLVHTYTSTETEDIELKPHIEVTNQAIEGHWLPLGPKGRGVALFSPPAFGDTLRWRLTYDIPNGLWDPLRSVGLDVFRYDLRTTPVRRFVVLFMVAPQARAVFVQERNGRGTVTTVERDQHDRWRVQWVASEPPTPAKYEWDIRVDWDFSTPRSQVTGGVNS